MAAELISEYEVVLVDPNDYRTYRCVDGPLKGEMVTLHRDSPWYARQTPEAELSWIYMKAYEKGDGGPAGSQWIEHTLVYKGLWKHEDRSTLRKVSMESWTNHADMLYGV